MPYGREQLTEDSFFVSGRDDDGYLIGKRIKLIPPLERRDSP
jgi:hypothetical protein